MNKKFKRFTAFVLSLIMILSILPLSVFAAYDYAHNEAASSDDYYDIISKKDWDIAPGIKESEIVLNNDAGDRRQVIHLMEADISNPYTRVISSYTNMDTSNYAISTIPEHAAYIENVWGENVVGAMNTCLSWYNSATYAQDPSRVNEPLGFMMVDSEIYFDHSVGFPTCIVIHKDVNENGETRPDSIPKVEMRTVTDASCLNGWEDQVIPCSAGYIVKDGINQNKPSHGSDTAARSVVGVKADGSIVIMMNDGRQAPYSLGMNMYECAEVMIAAGCVYAANCDGGGSSTFMSQRPGEDLNVNCSPCDGALRQNTHGIMFISTAPSTGEFENAYLKTENDYYVPNSSVKVEAVGRDFSGADAEIPADAVWALVDTSFGSIADGVFTSNGKTGDVTIQLIYNDKVVGSKLIHIVHPETVTFSQSSTVIPYGKSIVLDIKAMYGEFEVFYTADDFNWVVSDAAAGIREGLSFSATNDASKTSVKVSATYKYADLGTTTLDIIFGRGSEILYSFEDGDISHWLGRDELVEWAKINNPNSPIFDANPFGSNFSAGNDSTTFLATVENGKVKNGQYALGVELDYTHSGSFGQWSYNMFFNVGGQTVLRDTANGQNATRLGMWIYIPEELAPGHNFAMQTELYCGSSSTSYARKNTHLILECNGKTLTKCTEADIPEDRWVYCYMDLTPYNYVAIQNPYESTKDRREPQFIRFYTQSKEPFNAVFYFDDITLDYSDAVDDRNAPVISDAQVSVSGTTIRSFTAKVVDYVANNTSGLNLASAKIYVDGIALSGVSCNGTTISSPDVTLAPGKHTVTFEIADNMGNVMKKSQTFTVEGTAPITVGGHNDLNNVPQYDSVYYVDIQANAIETITTVTFDVYLNFANTWELDHMIVADGFAATYSLNKNHNVATVTVTKTGDVATGTATLVSIPVRVWSWDAEGAGFDSDKIGGNSYPLVYVKVDIRKGSVTFADGATGTFDGSLNVETAMLASVAPSGWHTHTETAVADKAGTCLTDGYTGRTYCDVCGSVVEWGTIIKAEGHDYQLTEGVLKCACGELFNGELNGNTYVDGVVADGWVNDTYYYVDGVKVTGSIFMNGAMYTFDENGVYMPDYKYDGFYDIDGTVMYFVGNNYLTGTQRISGLFYYFYENGYAYNGIVNFGGVECLFEKGLFVPTGNIKLAGMCGENAYFVLTTDGVFTVGGEGDMADYANVGLNPWYDTPYRNIVKTVVIGKDITSIGVRTFHYSPILSKVIFENGSAVKTLKSFSFSICPTLVSIDLPEGLETIEDSAFYKSTGLRNVYVPGSLKKLGGYAFGEVKQNVTLNVLEGSLAYQTASYQGFKVVVRPGIIASGTCGDSLTWTLYTDKNLVISGDGAMTDYTYNRNDVTAAPWSAYRTTITKVTIGENVTTIGAFAFYDCKYLTDVEFADSGALETIGDAAFGYTALTEVTIPATVKNICAHAFYYSKLVTVLFEENSKAETIGNYVFRNCTALKTVFIPDTVQYIGYEILYACGTQATLQVPEGRYAHQYANAYKYAVELRAPVPVVLDSGTCGDDLIWEYYDNGNLVISGSGVMTNYTYNRNDKTAAPWSKYRSVITKVTIGSDVMSIGAFAFYDCHKLASVEFATDGALETIGDAAFGYTALVDVTIPASVRTICAHAFYYCTKLTTLKFEEGSKLFTIGNYVFRNSTSMKVVYIPDSVKSIGYEILYACGTQATLDVAEGKIGYKYAKANGYAYQLHESAPVVLYGGSFGTGLVWDLYDNGTLVISGAGTMNDYNYNKYATDAAPWSLYRSQIKKVVIGSKVESIGAFAFYDCKNLIEVEFAANSALKTIGTGAFGYTALKTVTIPASVTIIKDHAFYYCASLVNFMVDEGSALSLIGDYAFRNSPALEQVIIPATTKLGIDIFYACGSQVVTRF